MIEIPMPARAPHVFCFDSSSLAFGIAKTSEANGNRAKWRKTCSLALANALLEELVIITEDVNLSGEQIGRIANRFHPLRSENVQQDRNGHSPQTHLLLGQGRARRANASLGFLHTSM